MSSDRYQHAHYPLIRLITAIILLGFALTGQAKEVTTSHRSLTVSAALEIAPGKSLTDGVILITHGGLAHRDMESIVYIRKLLADRGYNTLAINLSLELDRRTGMFDCKTTHRHRHVDAVDEIATWVSWLNRQGVKKIALLGHSRGAGQSAWYAAERDSKLVKVAILMAPQTRENGGTGYTQRYGKPLLPVLRDAQKLIRDGKGDTVIKPVNIAFCRDTAATAESFVSYYGADSRLHSPALIARTKVPTLVIVGGADEVVVGLDKAMAPLVDDKRIKMTVIDGADHFFRDLNTDDAVDEIDDFLQALNVF